MKVKSFGSSSMSGLQEQINKLFERAIAEDYAIWHISNIVVATVRGVQYYKILIFYDEGTEPLVPP